MSADTPPSSPAPQPASATGPSPDLPPQTSADAVPAPAQAPGAPASAPVLASALAQAPAAAAALPPEAVRAPEPAAPAAPNPAAAQPAATPHPAAAWLAHLPHLPHLPNWPAASPRLPGWAMGAALGLTALTVAALGLTWSTLERVGKLEQEQTHRLELAAETKTLSAQAQAQAQEARTHLGQLDARVNEALMQRTQVEELLQSLARSRDENVIADVDAALRVAQQQSAITGSADPMVNALRAADERLARYNQPRLERVRRAVVHDLDRVRSNANLDVPALAIKLDEAVRLVDELPLIAMPERHPKAAAAVAGRAASTAASAASDAAWWGRWHAQWQSWTGQAWAEVRSLVRVTRIERPEAALVSPEQTFFLRENLKLRLLNARLALLSRQFDLAQSDLQQVQDALNRYFDRSSRRVAVMTEQVAQVAAQCRTVSIPRAEESLAALAAAAAGR